MKTLRISIVLMLMVGAVASPIGFSYAEMSEQDQANMTEHAEKNMSEHTQQNMTGQANTISDDLENFGTQVSAFVHEAMIQFHDQRQETISQIKQCRENMMNAEPSERSQVRDDCRKNLDEIRDSYKEIRGTFQDTFKEFRDNFKVLLDDAKGHKVSDSAMQNAIKHIQEDARSKHLKMQKLGQNATDVEHLKERMMSVHKNR
jgi:hypothetical protein